MWALALGWGLAEASVFFIVPDVLLSRVALRSRRHAVACSALAVLGSMLGGALVYVWSLRDPGQLHAALLHVPGIHAGLIDGAGRLLHQLGGFAVVAGAYAGIPYKLFAAQAASAGLSLPVLMLLTVPARGLRFVLVSLLSHAIGQWLRGVGGSRLVTGVWWAVWIIVYVLYWSRL